MIFLEFIIGQSLFNTSCGVSNILILKMRKIRLSVVKSFAQILITNKWQSGVRTHHTCLSLKPNSVMPSRLSMRNISSVINSLKEIQLLKSNRSYCLTFLPGISNYRWTIWCDCYYLMLIKQSHTVFGPVKTGTM